MGCSRDATIMGSRNGHAPIYMWYTLTSKGYEGIRKDVERCLRNAHLLHVSLPGSQALQDARAAYQAEGEAVQGCCSMLACWACVLMRVNRVPSQPGHSAARLGCSTRGAGCSRLCRLACRDQRAFLSVLVACRPCCRRRGYAPC